MKIKQEVNLDRPLNGYQWVKEYNTLLNRVNKRYEELVKQLRYYDSARDDILHYIEMKKIDAIIGAKLMKKLKEVSYERRLVKEELKALSSIKDLSKKSKVKNNEEYVFKTNVVIDVLEELKGEE